MRPKLLACTGAAVVAAATLALSASAETPDEGICVMQQAVACGAFEACERALPAGVNLPALMRFDVAKGLIESRHQDGAIRTSKISSSSVEGGALLLQGVDGAHPWALRVNTTNGEFTLSILRELEGYLGFGVCSAKILEEPKQ